MEPKRHKYIKFFLGIIILVLFVLALFFIKKAEYTKPIVQNTKILNLNISIESTESMPVEKNIYGANLAKYWDEIGPWGDEDIKTLLTELSLNSIRNVGGLVHYQRVWLSDDQVEKLLTPEEKINLLPNNEVRGFGYIISDREKTGEEKEVQEITSPKSKYGGLSYLEGYQNKLPRNFIRDIVDISKVSNSSISYTINMKNGTPDEILEQISFLIDSGVNIEYVEMGNEMYSKGNDYYQSGDPKIQAQLAVSRYLDGAEEFRSKIKNVYPEIKFAVTSAPKKGFEETADGFDSDYSFNSQWNIALNEEMQERNYDTYVMHFYHGFFGCNDIYKTMDKNSIFECSVKELRTIDNESISNNLDTSIPVILEYYRKTFENKDMIVTEWNINQDNSKTGGALANSILHAAFVGDFINLLNKENSEHGNFIKLANYHTLSTSGGNAMINKRHVLNNTKNNEPEDVGNFVRRTPYFSFRSIRDVFKSNYVPAKITIRNLSQSDSLLEDIRMYPYINSKGQIAIYIVNLSYKDVDFESIKINEKYIDLEKSTGKIDYIYGEDPSYSKGYTEFSSKPQTEIQELNKNLDRISGQIIPAQGTGTIYINPEEKNSIPWLDYIKIL